MNSLKGIAIDDWVIEKEVKRDSMFSIFLGIPVTMLLLV